MLIVTFKGIIYFHESFFRCIVCFAVLPPRAFSSYLLPFYRQPLYNYLVSEKPERRKFRNCPY